MIEVSETEREEVISLCAKYLGCVWSEVKHDQIECQRMTSGLANKTFHVWIKESKGLVNNNEINNGVIVRKYNSGLFGKETKWKFNGEAGEAIIHVKLCEVGLASKILGVFDGGRIEEYIPSRTATVGDLKSNIELNKEVVRKLAKFHTLSMPICKKANLLENVASIVKQSVITPACLEKFPNEVEDCKLIMNFPFEEECAWIRQMLPIVGHKVIFSHNDMNLNNILLKENEKSGERVMLIDYERSGYFYRAYDLGYFFRFKKIHLSMGNNKVNISYDKDDDSVRDLLLQEYLQEYSKITNDFDPKYDNLERLRMEVDFFDLVCDLFFIGSSIPIIVGTSIPFPMATIATIASTYRDRKQRLVTKYGDPLHWRNDEDENEGEAMKK